MKLRDARNLLRLSIESEREGATEQGQFPVECGLGRPLGLPLLHILGNLRRANTRSPPAIEEGEAKIAEKLDITAGYILEKIKDTIEKCSTEKFRPAAVLRGLELLGKYLKLENKVTPEDETFSSARKHPLALGFDSLEDAAGRDRSRQQKQEQSQGAEPVSPVEKPEQAAPVIPIDRKLVN